VEVLHLALEAFAVLLLAALLLTRAAQRFLQLAAIEPYAAAARAHVELGVGALHVLHRDVAIRAKQRAGMLLGREPSM